MEASLRAVLITDPALVAIVPADSIVWNHLPQDTPRPAIVLYLISGGPGIHMRGSDGLINATVQIDVQATSVNEMWAIRDALLTLLHGYGSDPFLGIMNIGQRQSSEMLEGGGLLQRASLDFDVWAASA